MAYKNAKNSARVARIQKTLAALSIVSAAGCVRYLPENAAFYKMKYEEETKRRIAAEALLDDCEKLGDDMQVYMP